jgi:LysM repeat protein
MNNRTRLHAVIAIPVLLVLVLTLAACEKDRPVQTPESGTAQPLSGQATPATPGSAETPGLSSTVTTAGSQSTPASPTQSGAATTKPAASPTAVGGAATQVPRKDSVYTVQLGDTLGSIAKQFGVTADAIIQSNSLTNPDVLMVGQELKIPGQQTASTESSSGQTTEDVYVVSQGDTLGSIAQRFGVPVDELQDLNDIADPNEIFVGQELRIPTSVSSGEEPETSDQDKTYVVQQGETLFKIALRFGITLEALQEANNITDPDKVYPGQVLKIP